MDEKAPNLRPDMSGRADSALLRSRRTGTPLWLQLILSLIVIAAALIVAGLYLPSANALLKTAGIDLPILTAEAQPAAATAQGGAQQGGGRQANAATQAGGQQGGNRNAGGAGGQGRFGGGNRTAVVITEPVTSALINDKLTAIGEGSAASSATITSTSGGTLTSVLVKPGDVVREGQQLAQLDAQTQQIAFDRANSCLHRCRCRARPRHRTVEGELHLGRAAQRGTACRRQRQT